ncbi:hypothetical protein D9758_007900 [Tetrapyrgos nigripes]|uniref:Cysteine-rich protein 1 n=1 Tax=Tetrapyrgos nigripes TaxID=182062 RepID=A0A8H5D3J6_9AGAR|nr:hypothetical protein D9758_007900 [Tetrapyrgos nigripes]
MHPYGGTPRCPRCSKAVYAAEQVMGPGRKLYHKPCLSCTSCNKRLDSFTLLEHDEQPYCKICHSRNFGTRDLRSANLPVVPHYSKAPISPPRTNGAVSSSSPPSSPPQRGSDADTPPSQSEAEAIDAQAEAIDTLNALNGALASSSPRTILPLKQTATGTRYGAALGEGRAVTIHSTGSSPRKFGGNTPSCPKCGKSVYFAEQVKAVGKTYHRGCLRCNECNTALDSTRLRDHEGAPFCGRCHNKLHGPQGNGYALLGKAGG